jgi:hypothetical protein
VGAVDLVPIGLGTTSRVCQLCEPSHDAVGVPWLGAVLPSVNSLPGGTVLPLPLFRPRMYGSALGRLAPRDR